MSDNPFDDSPRWEVGLEGGVLQKGNYVAEITQAEDGSSSKGNPQIELKFTAEEGFIRAWEVYHSEFLNRVASLYDKSGTKLPQQGEFDPDDNSRISQKALDRLVGQKVGIVVIEEPKQNDPSTMRSKVFVYVEPSRISGEPDTRGLPTATATAAGSSTDNDDNDIPF